MSTFGASAPGNDLFKHFEITTEKVVSTAKEALKSN
jgi:transketolase